MTSNQRRPGFRLPWSAETEDEPNAPTSPRPQNGTPADGAAVVTGPAQASAPQAAGGETAKAEAPQVEEATGTATSDPTAATPGAPSAAATEMSAPAAAPVASATPTPEPAPRAEAETPNDFLKDLVTAMRRVADEARESGIAELRTRTDEQVRQLEVEADRRREELRTLAEADIAGVGEWAKAEAERIRAEAEQRVAARRAQLEQQIAAEATRAEAEAKAMRERVAEFERELDAYHSQLAEISDPAAFAAAAKRMPRPPTALRSPAASEPAADANGSTPSSVDALQAAGEEVLAARLAELDATLDKPATTTNTGPATSNGEPVTTEVVVKGLGSFGAITGFRQSLAGVDGIDGVTLSLGPTGEFVFRASHAAGFDLGAAITTLEGDAATVEARPEGGLKVTLERSR